MHIFTQRIEHFVLVKTQNKMHTTYIKLLMNTTLVLMRKIKKLYKGGLEPGTLEPHTFLKKVLPLDYQRSKVNNSNVYIYSMLWRLSALTILYYYYFYRYQYCLHHQGPVCNVGRPTCALGPPRHMHGSQWPHGCTVYSYATEREHDPGSPARVDEPQRTEEEFWHRNSFIFRFLLGRKWAVTPNKLYFNTCGTFWTFALCINVRILSKSIKTRILRQNGGEN